MGAALAAVALVVGAGGGYAVGRTTAGGSSEDAHSDEHGDEHGHEAGSIEAIAEELAAEQAADRAALSVELAEAARTAYDQLGNVLRAMSSTVPVEGAATAPVSPEVTADDARTWVASLDGAADTVAAVPEGTAEHNVTRQALLGSALMLSDAVEELAAGLEASTLSPDVVQQVAAQRLAAVDLWQAGAAQLDGLVVEAGEEHIHLFLAPSGDPDAVPREFQEPEAP